MYMEKVYKKLDIFIYFFFLMYEYKKILINGWYI